MDRGDVGWSEARRASSRTLAFYLESKGIEWTSLREAVPQVALELHVPIGRRSDTAIACHEILVARGVVPPMDYIVPWLRDTPHRIAVLARRPRRRAVRRAARTT